MFWKNGSEYMENEIFKLLAENAADLICLHNNHGNCLYISPSVERILGYKPEEIIGKNAYDFIYFDDIEIRKCEVQNKLLREKKHQRIEHKIKRKDGTYIWVETIVTPNVNEHGDVISVGTCSRDISQRKLEEKSMKACKEKFTKLFHLNPFSMVVINISDWRIVEANEAFIQNFGDEDKSIIGYNTKKMNLLLNCNVRDEIIKKAKIDGKVKDFEAEVKYRNGQRAIVSINLDTINIDSKEYFLLVIIDITERKDKEKTISYNASHDALTCVPNRYILEQKLNSTIEKARYRSELAAVMFIDIDGFKQVNDTLGHKAGDELLKEIANRLKTALREEDTVTRFGGDEFVIILPRIDKKEILIKIAERINNICRMKISIKSMYVSISSSIGISLFPNDGEDMDSLVKNADAAMYRAKGFGKDKYCFYS